MSERLIYRIQETQDSEYPYNVQEIKIIQGQEVYSGFGRFCQTLEEANAYISGRRGEHGIKMTDAQGQKMAKKMDDRIEFMFTNLEGMTNRHYFLTGMGSALELLWESGVITREQYESLDDQIEDADEKNTENRY